MRDGPPDPNQYDLPPALKELHEKRIRAMEGDQIQTTTAGGSGPKSELPVPVKEAPPWVNGLSQRAISVLKTNTKLSDSLLSWLAIHLNSQSKQLAINANGFIVNVEVHDIKLENGQLLITIPSDAKISFVLEDGAVLKLRWEEDKEWQSFIYLQKLEFGHGFPFFFMVFLENNV